MGDISISGASILTLSYRQRKASSGTIFLKRFTVDRIMERTTAEHFGKKDLLEVSCISHTTDEFWIPIGQTEVELRHLGLMIKMLGPKVNRVTVDIVTFSFKRLWKESPASALYSIKTEEL